MKPLIKDINFKCPETQKRLTRLVKEAVVIYVGEANNGSNMNDIYLNLDLQMFLNKPQDRIKYKEISKLEEECYDEI